MKLHDMPSHMERGAYPPEYDEPETTASEVLAVIFGRRTFDGVGRDYSDLMSDTSMMCWAENVTVDLDAEQELMTFIGKNLHALPRVKAILDNLAESAAKQDTWRT